MANHTITTFWVLSNGSLTMTIRIVTDSTCDLPPAAIEAYGITVVPVYINIGDESYQEGVEISRRQFYENLYNYPVYPTTAAPAPGAFTAVYEQLTAAGATQILSIHVAASLSNVLNAARLGAEAAQSAPVTLFDSQQITAGSGLLLIAAAEAAAAACTMAEIVARLQQYTAQTYVFGVIEKLESLRRSGRVNWTEYGIGSLLQLKPVMMIHQGKITVQAKVRTAKRARQHVLDLVGSLQPFLYLAVIHAHALDAARELQRLATDLFPQGQEPLLLEITPAVGTHLGLGALGFACITAT